MQVYLLDADGRFDPQHPALVDPYGGRRDLRLGLVRQLTGQYATLDLAAEGVMGCGRVPGRMDGAAISLTEVCAHCRAPTARPFVCY